MAYIQMFDFSEKQNQITKLCSFKTYTLYVPNDFQTQQKSLHECLAEGHCMVKDTAWLKVSCICYAYLGALMMRLIF